MPADDTRDPNLEADGPEETFPPLAEARIQQRSSLSIVWLIPLIAALVGAWLVYKAVSERGPEVTIRFRTAESVEAGKTKVRYKDVEIGLVESVALSEDLKHVEVKARLVADAERFLTEKTRFWVVRARLSAGQVTGISTVLSGAYISLDPSLEGEPQRVFEGLETPPIVTQDEAGTLFTLHAEDLGSIEVGSPVYYRWIKVGQVAAYDLDESGDGITIQAFVRAPHDARVTTETRFWNASGLDVSIGADGVQIDTVSLVALLIGGIAFDTEGSAEAVEAVVPGTVFHLYPNKSATTRQHYSIRRRFLLYFDQSVRGLAPGSPVEFRGIPIGEVQDVKLVYDPETGNARIPVVIEIEPERISVAGAQDADISDRPAKLVARGMRAQLRSGNLLTGQLAINLDFHPNAPPATIRTDGRYPELPTIPSPLEQITSSVADILDRIGQVPIEKIGSDLASALAKLDATLVELRSAGETVNREIAPTLLAALENAERTLASTESFVAPDSATGRELRRLIVELAEAARSVRLLADRLEQHPEELLRGKSP